MKLKSVRVRLYRNILDTKEVDVQEDITSLVGKNESGKTSFLHALHALNPAVAKPLSLMDYPAWLKKAHQLRGDKLDEVVPVKATFLLDEQEREDATDEFGAAVDGLESVTFSRNYGGKLVVEASFDEAIWTSEFIEAHCRGLLGTAEPKTATELAELLQKIAQTAPAEGQEDLRQSASQARAELQKQSGPQFTPKATLIKWLSERMPKFLYVGRYHTLQGQIDIQRIRSAPYEQLGEDERIAKSLLDLSSADVGQAMGADYELRKRELNDTANALTLEVLEYWTQNTNIRVEIDFDQTTQNNQSIVKHLHVRLYDSEHMISLPFGERSSGFQWFFSFLCAFSRYRLLGDPIILLLDEPALGLHARAQRDFLRYIEEKLVETCQVVYSTHSPFMVQPKHMERVRLVEDKGRKEGSTVSADALSTDPDTIFPLQGALGYDLAQSLFVGPHNLIVEGTSDFTYLQLLSDHLKAEGRTGLDERCTIVPVGGAEKIATFAALLGSHVDATVLIDSTKQGNQRLDTLIQQGILKQSRLIGIGEIVGQPEADIEDLFSVAEYLSLFNETFGTSYKEGDLNGTDPIVRRLARAQSVTRYDHGKPATVLLKKTKTVIGKLSKNTLDNFERLFERINGTLPA